MSSATRTLFLVLSIGFIWAASTRGPAVLAQHATAADIEDGGRVFRNSCANCHGPDGNQIAGIDLGRGQFRRPFTDDELVGIIQKGIPNTPMPASNFSDEQARHVVAFLRSMAASTLTTKMTGDAVRGKAIFEGKGGCTGCHRVNSIGSRVGPDLTKIGQLRRAIELEQSLIEPGREIVPNNRYYRVVTREGTVVTGRLLNLDTFTVQLIDSKEQLRSFQKSALKEHGFAPSPMPSYRDTLTPQELADVVGYLTSLKGQAAS